MSFRRSIGNEQPYAVGGIIPAPEPAARGVIVAGNQRVGMEVWQLLSPVLQRTTVIATRPEQIRGMYIDQIWDAGAGGATGPDYVRYADTLAVAYQSRTAHLARMRPL